MACSEATHEVILLILLIERTLHAIKNLRRFTAATNVRTTMRYNVKVSSLIHSVNPPHARERFTNTLSVSESLFLYSTDSNQLNRFVTTSCTSRMPFIVSSTRSARLGGHTARRASRRERESGHQATAVQLIKRKPNRYVRIEPAARL